MSFELWVCGTLFIAMQIGLAIVSPRQHTILCAICCVWLYFYGLPWVNTHNPEWLGVLHDFYAAHATMNPHTSNAPATSV